MMLAHRATLQNVNQKEQALASLVPFIATWECAKVLVGKHPMVPPAGSSVTGLQCLMRASRP